MPSDKMKYLLGGVHTSGRWEEVVKEGEYGAKYCVHTYINGKMVSVETTPGMGKGGMKENGEGG
jgi:hypothetical protein